MKILRFDSWNTTPCPCCKQEIFITVATPEAIADPAVIFMKSGFVIDEREAHKTVNAILQQHTLANASA